MAQPRPLLSEMSGVMFIYYWKFVTCCNIKCFVSDCVFYELRKDYVELCQTVLIGIVCNTYSGQETDMINDRLIQICYHGNDSSSNIGTPYAILYE